MDVTKMNKVVELLSQTENVDIDYINNDTNDVAQILLHAAIETCGHTTAKSKHRNVKNQESWFDNECKEAQSKITAVENDLTNVKITKIKLL